MLTKTTKNILRVAFMGDAEAKKTDQHFIDAFETAKLLAKNGFIIVNGGGPGVMLASTLGAKESNGRVEVVVLDPKKQPNNYEGINKENFSLANKKIITSNYPNRLNKIVEIADAFVIFKGGTGTISEMGLTWEMAKFEYGHHEPLFFFGECWKDIINDMARDLNLESKEKKVYELVDTPEEILRLLQKKKRIKSIGLLGKLLNLIQKA